MVEVADGGLEGLGEGKFGGLVLKAFEGGEDELFDFVGVGGNFFDDVDDDGGVRFNVLGSIDDGVAEVVDLEGEVNLPVDGGSGVVGGCESIGGVGGQVLEDDLVDDGGIDGSVHGADFEDGDEVGVLEIFFGKVAIEGKKEVFLEGIKVGEEQVKGVVDDGSVDGGEDVADGGLAGLDF